MSRSDRFDRIAFIVACVLLAPVLAALAVVAAPGLALALAYVALTRAYAGAEYLNALLSGPARVRPSRAVATRTGTGAGPAVLSAYPYAWEVVQPTSPAAPLMEATPESIAFASMFADEEIPATNATRIVVESFDVELCGTTAHVECWVDVEPATEACVTAACSPVASTLTIRPDQRSQAAGYIGWSYRDIQREAKRRGLPAKGSRQVLVARLLTSDGEVS